MFLGELYSSYYYKIQQTGAKLLNPFVKLLFLCLEFVTFSYLCNHIT